MAKFFNYFPRTFYTSNNDTTGVDSVINITARSAFEKTLRENSTNFYSYQIQDSDTPEIIADKYYDNPERHWIVLLFNDIIDPQWDWPLNDKNIIEYIDKKYTANGAANTTIQTGIAWALSENNTQAYFKVITTTGKNGEITVEKFEVDANTYANVTSSTNFYTTQANESITIVVSKEKRSYYTYEIEENEKKREIKLLKNQFVDDVEKEFKRIIRL